MVDLEMLGLRCCCCCSYCFISYTRTSNLLKNGDPKLFKNFTYIGENGQDPIKIDKATILVSP